MFAISLNAMEKSPATAGIGEIGALLRGESERIREWLEQGSARRTWLHAAVIIIGTGSFGAAMGWWRDPLQALYTAIKFPLIIFLTTVGNGMLNWMLASLLGLKISFRQSLQAVMTSYTIVALILGALSPLLFFLVWNAPPMKPGAWGPYSFIQLTNVAAIAFAGVTSNLRLGQLLRRIGGGVGAGRRVLLAWLAGNLLLGSQLSWILRPFIGSPGMPVQFLRAGAFKGNFYETVFHAIGNLW
jgi:hypothetical protein